MEKEFRSQKSDVRSVFTGIKRLGVTAFLIFNFSFLVSPSNAQVVPIDTRLIVSGAFGEPRDNHFHTGIDFTTQGRTGVKVFAFNDGYVSRIKVSSVGYGKALYINHPDGTMSVYGHLERFNDVIQQHVTEEQYKAKKFEQELYPAKDKFKIKKGEVIGYSGNSGGSSGPHLHFEVRDASGESFPLNPLAKGLVVKDTIAPVLRSIVFYDRSGATEKQLREYPLSKRGADYSNDGNAVADTVTVATPAVAFGVRTDDRFNGSVDDFVGVYSINVTVDGKPFFGFAQDRLDFAEGRCANAHIDFERRKQTKQRVYRLYKLPGNHASIYNTTNPFLALNDGKPRQVSVVVKDFQGNTATYNFFIRNTSGKTYNLRSVDDADYVIPTKAFAASGDNFRLQTEAGTFYDAFFFSWRKAGERGSAVTSSYDVGDTHVAVHKAYTLSLKPEVTVKESLRGKCVIMRGDNAYTTEWNDGWLTAKPREFGVFRAVIDTVAPRVSPVNFKSGGAAPANPKLTITDAASGVKDYDVFIDGEWVLAEYDAKNDLLTAMPKQKPAKGVRELKAVVTDKVGNKRTYTYTLTF